MPGAAPPVPRPRQLVVSSSAKARLEAAQAWLRSFARDRELLVLVPHAIAADQLIHALVTDGGSRFGIQRFTLNRLASHLATPELATAVTVPDRSRLEHIHAFPQFLPDGRRFLYFILNERRERRGEESGPRR